MECLKGFSGSARLEETINARMHRLSLNQVDGVARIWLWLRDEHTEKWCKSCAKDPIVRHVARDKILSLACGVSEPAWAGNSRIQVMQFLTHNCCIVHVHISDVCKNGVAVGSLSSAPDSEPFSKLALDPIDKAVCVCKRSKDAKGWKQTTHA